MFIPINNLKELNQALEKSVGYFVGVTLFDGKGLNHYFLTENFPQSDLLRSLTKIKGLVIEELEKPFVPPLMASDVINIKTIEAKDDNTSKNS